MKLPLVLSVLVPLSLFAQQRFDDTVTVNVVEVPVYVERFGHPVTGLTRDDFELFVNGQPQPIEYFDVLDERSDKREKTAAADARTSAPAPAELKRRRLVVLLFDIGASSAYSLQRARIKAVQYLSENESGDTYAVATIGRGGVRFLVPFTTDRVAVQRAIGTLAPSQAADPFRVATLDTERGLWREAVGGAEAGLGSVVDLWGGGPGGFTGMSVAAATALDSYRTVYAWEEQQRYLGDWQFVNDLGDLADRLAPLSGVKHVVLMSERPGISDAATLYQPVMRIQKRYRAAGVVLDAVDIRPQSAPGGTASNSAPTANNRMPNFLASNFLYALALDTGGTATTSFRTLQYRNSVTYVLGFRPSRAQSQTNAIRVRVKNRPWLTDVRYRTSFSLAADNRKDDSLFLADTLLNDIPQRGVTLDLDVQGSWVAAKIPGAELLAHPSDKPVALDVFFYVFDERGQAVAWNQLQIRVDLEKGREFLESNPYAIRQEFRLEPGRYAAKALVRIAGTEMTGFAREDFVVR